MGKHGRGREEGRREGAGKKEKRMEWKKKGSEGKGEKGEREEGREKGIKKKENRKGRGRESSQWKLYTPEV